MTEDLLLFAKVCRAAGCSFINLDFVFALTIVGDLPNRLETLVRSKDFGGVNPPISDPKPGVDTGLQESNISILFF